MSEETIKREARCLVCFDILKEDIIKLTPNLKAKDLNKFSGIELFVHKTCLEKHNKATWSKEIKKDIFSLKHTIQHGFDPKIIPIFKRISEFSNE